MSAQTTATGLPIGKIKPLKTQDSTNSRTMSKLSYSQLSAVKMNQLSSTEPFDISCELPLSGVETDTDDEVDNSGGDESKFTTLSRPDKQIADNNSSRIPRPRHLRSTFVPIQKSRNTEVTPRSRRTGTPLQELDRKWALQECEDLTTWTSELLNSQGKRLNKDLRNAISDGFTLPAVIEIVFNKRINTLRADIELSKEERVEILGECVDYLNTVDCDLTNISAQDLECGDLKAILTVLAAIKLTMGQDKSKPSGRRADRTKLLGQENGYVMEGKVGKQNPSPVSQDGVVIVPSKHANEEHSPRKVLTTFQRPVVENRRQDGERPLKSIMKGSVSLDNLDDQRSNTIILGRSKSQDRQRLGRRSASNVSINVDSGEQEFDEEDYLPPPSHQQFRSLSVDAKRASIACSNNDSDVTRKSAFSYLSSRGRLRHDSREQDHTRLSYQALLVRGQPSGDSNPSTPSVRESANTDLTQQQQRSINSSPANTKPPNSAPDSRASNKSAEKGRRAQHERKSSRGRRSKSETGQKSNSLDNQKSSSREQQRVGSSSSDKSTSADRPARERPSHRHRQKSSKPNTKQYKEENNNSPQPAQECQGQQPQALPNGYGRESPRILNDKEKLSDGVDSVADIQSYTHSPRHHPPHKNSPRTEAKQTQDKNNDSLSRSETFTVRSSPEERVRQSSVSTTSTVTPPTPPLRGVVPPTPPARGISQSCSVTDAHTVQPEQSYTETGSEKRLSGGQEVVYYDPVPISVHHSLQANDTNSHNGPTNTPSPYHGLTEAQLRRLSMPTAFQYRDTDDNKTRHSSDRSRRDSGKKKDSTLQEWTTLDNANMEDSFYDNNPRSNTPTLPALTDNTDIESVSDALHNRRYKRSASVSDRMLFTTGDTHEACPEQTTKEYEKETLVVVKPRKKSGQSNRRPSRHKKPPQPTKADTDKDTDIPSLEDKVVQLEKLFENLVSVVGVEKDMPVDSKRSSLAESVSSQRSGIASKYSRRHRRSSESKSNKKRFERIESHIMTLAKSVAHISSEMRSNVAMHAEIERLSTEVNFMKKTMEGKEAQTHHTKPAKILSTDKQGKSTSSPVAESQHRARKLNKLTQFFGREPPMMKFFLRELGYEKYTSKFEKSQIGVLELPYVTEEQLKSIGIPLGPRMRIMQEAKDIQKEIKYVEGQQSLPPSNGHIGKVM